jgi:hypothetical protein
MFQYLLLISLILILFAGYIYRDKVESFLRKYYKKITSIIIIFGLVGSGIVLWDNSDEKTTPSDEVTPEPYHYFYAPENSFGISSWKSVNWSYFWSFFENNTYYKCAYFNKTSGGWTDCSDYLSIGINRSDNNTFEKHNISIIDAPVTGKYRWTYWIATDTTDLTNVSDSPQVNLSIPIPNSNESYHVFWNWSDISNNSDLDFDWGLHENISGKNYFYFTVTTTGLTINQGETVSFDPTYGSTYSGIDLIIANDYQNGLKITTTTAGTFTKITAKLKTFDFDSNAKAMLYSSSGSLLRASSEVALDQSTIKPYDFDIKDYSFSNSETYYITAFSDGFVYSAWSSSGTETGVRERDEYDDGAESSVIWDTEDTSADAYIYITYTESDTDPPTPNPMTWSSVPDADDADSISMTATAASDSSTPISYYFDETTGHSGGSDSGWQSNDRTYTDTGLSENTQYTYRCNAKDSEGNAGSYSSTSSEYTECNAPTDAEVTIDSYGSTWIKVYVDECPNPTADDTDCYIDCVSGGATDADYADTSRENSHFYYNFTGLSESTEYCFKAKYRNGDGVETSLNNNAECQTTDSAGWSNIAPTVEAEYPSDGATGVSISPDMHVEVNDSDGNASTVYWKIDTDSNVNDTSMDTHQNTSILNQTAYYNITGLEYNTEYFVGVWANDTHDNTSKYWSFTTESENLTYYEVSIRATGEDYFVWLGDNCTLDDVAENISGFDEAGETISVLADNGHFVNLTGTGTSSQSVSTFDVIKVVLDDAGNVTVNMTANSDINNFNNRTFNLVDIGNGYNYTGWSNSVSSTLGAEADAMSMSNGEFIGVWNTTSYSWQWHIQGFNLNNNVAINKWDVVLTKITADRTWNQG